MKKWSGISLKCDSLSINKSLDFSDIGQSENSTKLESSALEWIESTLKDDLKISKEIYDLLVTWVSAYSSSYILFTVDGYGDIQLSKKFITS